MLTLLRRAWTWLTDDHVVGTTPGVARYFSRCDACKRVFMNYWAIKPHNEPGRVGCPCGGVKVRIVHIPEWQAAYYVVTRYLWRKLILRRRYWDPRIAERRVPLDA